MCPCDHTSENGQSTRKRTQTLIPQKKLPDRILIFVSLTEAFHRKGNATRTKNTASQISNSFLNETWTSVGRDARTRVTVWRISAVNKLKKRSPRKKTSPSLFHVAEKKRRSRNNILWHTGWKFTHDCSQFFFFSQFKLDKSSSGRAITVQRNLLSSH